MNDAERIAAWGTAIAAILAALGQFVYNFIKQRQRLLSEDRNLDQRRRHKDEDRALAEWQRLAEERGRIAELATKKWEEGIKARLEDQMRITAAVTRLTLREKTLEGLQRENEELKKQLEGRHDGAETA